MSTPATPLVTPPPPYSAGMMQGQGSTAVAPAPMPPNAFPPEKQQYQQSPDPQAALMQQLQSMTLAGPQQMQQPGMPMQQQAPAAMTPQQQQELQNMLQQMPPEKLQLLQAQVLSQQQQQQQQQTQLMPPQQMQLQPAPQPVQQQSWSAPPIVDAYIPPNPVQAGAVGGQAATGKDEKQAGKAKRFLGDTLVGRFARASVQTASTTFKMPQALSPWGDNNPVTLPNVRYRDAVLFTTFAFVGAPLIEGGSSIVTDVFGADSFVSDIVSSGAGFITGNTIVKYGVFQIIEQAIDKGVLEHMLPEEEKLVQTLNVKSLQVTVKHKLMGVDADLRFAGIYAARNQQAIAKGWFCPYLFASARTPLLPRANDFAIAQSFGPFLAGDYAMAHKLVAESAHALAMCDADPTNNIGTNRMVCVFTGIAPYRAGMWSTSRRPGCGTLIFHLFDGCPALILPVTAKAPVVGWSPWTLAQMHAGGGEYQPEWQHQQICEWLDTVISVPHLTPSLQGRYVDILGRAVSLLVNGAMNLNSPQSKTVLGKIDPERAGFVFFRY